MAKSSIPAFVDENDSTTILASLCVNAPDAEIRDFLRRYNHDKTYSKNKTLLKSAKKDIVVRAANYLNVDTSNIDNENKEMKKDDIIHEIICRIQNLLPDECQVCNKPYRLDREEPPYLSCDVCGQEVHKPCFMELLQITDSEQIPNINPHNLPGIHYFCKECENEVSRLLEIKFPDIRRKVTIDLESDKSIGQQQNADTLYSEGIIHSSQVPSGSASTNSVSISVAAETETLHSKTPTATSIVIDSDKSANNVDSFLQPLDSSDNNNNPKETNSRGKHKKVKESTEHSSSKDERSGKTCAYYTRNECKYGTKGSNCPFNHPEPCKQLISFGTKQPSGCNKGRNCKDFHPKICPSSITKKECFDHGCHLTHIKGTIRKPKKSPPEKDPIKKDKNSDSKVPSNQESYTKSNETGSFLELARLIKEELMEAMDQKIALAMTQLPQPQQPRKEAQQAVQAPVSQQPGILQQQPDHSPQPLLGTIPHQLAMIAPHYQIPPMHYQPPFFTNQTSLPQLQYTQQLYPMMPQNQGIQLMQPNLQMAAMTPNPLPQQPTQTQF